MLLYLLDLGCFESCWLLYTVYGGGTPPIGGGARELLIDANVQCSMPVMVRPWETHSMFYIL